MIDRKVIIRAAVEAALDRPDAGTTIPELATTVILVLADLAPVPSILGETRQRTTRWWTP